MRYAPCALRSFDTVKSFMKNRSVTYRKTMKTLPLVEDPAELWRGGGEGTGWG